MESQTPTPSESVPKRWHLFPAGLSLLCPGLGQLVQGRPVFLWYVLIWGLLIADGLLFFRVLHEFEVRFLTPHVMIFCLFCLPFLLVIPFMLISVLDAALWEPGKPSQFKKYFTGLVWIFVLLSIFVFLLAPAISLPRSARFVSVCEYVNRDIPGIFANLSTDCCLVQPHDCGSATGMVQCAS